MMPRWREWMPLIVLLTVSASAFASLLRCPVPWNRAAGCGIIAAYLCWLRWLAAKRRRIERELERQSAAIKKEHEWHAEG